MGYARQNAQQASPNAVFLREYNALKLALDADLCGNQAACVDDSNADMYSPMLRAYNAPKVRIAALPHLYDVVNAYARFQNFGHEVVRCNREASLDLIDVEE